MVVKLYQRRCPLYGVCSLSIRNRVLARVIAARLRDWSEEFGALDDNQDGFRQNRSTADTTQITIRLQKDNRVICENESLSRDKAFVLDVKKAYPRLSGPLR